MLSCRLVDFKISEDFAMKKLLVIVFAIFALVMSQELRAVATSRGAANIPPPVGGYASTAQGSFAVCLDPDTFAEESCTTAGAVVLPINYLAAGELTFDYNGNACGTFVQDGSDIPVGASSSQVSTSTNVGKFLNYDPTTGIGDLSFTAYSGGKCQGATFDAAGATIASTGTGHFVVSRGGNRVDGIFTSLTSPSGGFGGFSLSFVYFKQ
jgi:hypothetical protein